MAVSDKPRPTHLGSATVDLVRLMQPVAQLLLGEPNPRLSTRRKLRFGNQGSLSVDLNRGAWHDFELGQGGGVLDLIERETRLIGRNAFEWIERYVGANTDIQTLLPEHKRSTHPPKPSTNSKKVDRYWKRLWDGCVPIAGDDPAGIYLQARGCALPPVEGDLRWHESVRHPSGWTGPALVALITNIHDEAPLNLMRTWIDESRPGKKSPIERPRLLLKGHRKQGGVIRLYPDYCVSVAVLIAEGTETALAAARGFRPAWAAIDAGNLASLPVLPGLEAITIIADHDQQNPQTGRRAGLEAARTLAGRYVDAGFDPERDVRIWTAPSEGADFADLAAEVIE